MKNIAIVAGGTGGHIYPALSVADALYQRGYQIYYVGNEHKMEKNILAQYPQYTFLPINNEGLKPGLTHKLKGVFSQFKAIKQCKQYLKQYDIDCVLSFGGYVSFPLVFSAQQLKIPTLLHEANAIAGKANKMVAKKASGIAICYQKTGDDFKNSANVRLIGNPRASDAYYQIKRHEILQTYDLSDNMPIVYIVMGSLGSSSVSDIIIEMLNNYIFTNVQFVISAGERTYQQYQQALKNKNNYTVISHIDQIALLKHCDVVISRAGASSIAEILASATPSILIPSPYVANNHQYYNAIECHLQQAALMLEETQLTADKLHDELQKLLYDETLRTQMKTQALQMAHVNANSDLVQWVEELVDEHRLVK